ncbi:transferase hexapeptide repeat family protein [Aliikangiella coralliicola]|uniref:Transferase hexapeptide repeat family protein n=1 Tax=Aliikangiella coralliicola TaxID=2592383 RepID=A0A545U526_9GAMM|nr:transferase hexapeptide repeat family protein [Aliikangiella coralliicola]TQV84569.1 transferase hexapeptide repeat family protein [Aliikangiella coralliicola]
MPIYAIDDFIPVVKPNTYVHPSAEIIGDVIIEENCYIGPCAVLRGDFGRIHVSHHSNVQDNCVLHSFPDKDCFLEPYSHIGHCAVLHGCRIGENSLIGMNAVVMDDTVIGKESMVAASSFVRAKFQCEPRSMVMGIPAKVIRQMTEQEIHWKGQGTQEYIDLAERSINTMRITEALIEEQPNRPRFQDSIHQTKS